MPIEEQGKIKSEIAELKKSFDVWIKDEHYQIINKLIIDKNNKLSEFLIEGNSKYQLSFVEHTFN